jgi:hypothetical protein
MRQSVAGDRRLGDNGSLVEAFARVGERYGYMDVKAEFAAFRDFKVKWVRSYKWVNFDVSDYLMDAPVEVLEGLADTLYMRMKGESEARYNPTVIGWLTSKEFRDINQPIYLTRYRSTSVGTRGKVRDLSDSVTRLVEAGLIDRDPEIKLRWALDSRTNSSSKSSVLMKAIIVSDRLDSEDVTDHVLDYVVYSQISNIAMGYDQNRSSRSGEYARLLERYPMMSEAEEGLRMMDMTL